MSPRILRLVAAPLLVLLALASCSSDDDGASDSTVAEPDEPLIPPASTASNPGDGDAGVLAGTPDPCASITPAGIAVVLGEPAPTGSQSILPQPPTNLRQCQWSAGDGQRVVFLSLQTTEGFHEGNLGGYGASDQYEVVRSALPNAVDISGLGDAAFFTDPSETKLSVLSGDAFVEITTQASGGAEPITGEQLRALMDEALAAL